MPIAVLGKFPADPAALCTFKTVKLKARTGVNPQTGAKIKIPAKNAFKFSASKNPKF